MIKALRQLTVKLADYSELQAVHYQSRNGHWYYKLRTADGRPLILIKETDYHELDKEDFIVGMLGTYKRLDVNKMKDALKKYNDRKAEIAKWKAEKQERKRLGITKRTKKAA